MKHFLLILFSFTSILLKAQDKTTFDYYQLALNCSKDNDSLKASEAFMKVDPYYIYFLGQTVASLDSFYKRFALTSKAKEQYRELFRNTALAPKTEMFMEMEDAHKRYNELKKAHIDAPANAETGPLIAIDKLDSASAAGLYEYVKVKGWPSIANGGLYAGQLVMRDYWHSPYYDTSGIIKRATEQGLLPSHVLRYLQENRHNLSMRRQIHKLLRPGYLSFDVTDFLYSQRPEVMSRVVEAIKSACPVKAIFMVCEVKNRSEQQRVIEEAKKLEGIYGNNSATLHGEAAKACPAFFENWKDDAGTPGHLETIMIYNGRKNEKITLYIVPGASR
jgi:hypothetical protein